MAPDTDTPLRATALAAALAALALAAAVGGAAAAATVTGTVSTETGESPSEAWVLAQPADATVFEELALDRSPHEGFLKLARVAGDHDRIAVARPDDGGAYGLDLPTGGAHDVVAVSPAGLSRVRTVEPNGTADLVLDPHRVQRVEAGTATAAPGGTATVTVRVRNRDDDQIEGVRIVLAPAPRDVTLRDVDPAGDGRYDASAGVVRWETVPGNGSVAVTLRLSVAGDADRGQRRLALSADSETHVLDHTADAVVAVRPADAPTTTALPGSVTTGGDAGGTTGQRLPGFGVGVAAVALLAGVVGLGRSGRR